MVFGLLLALFGLFLFFPLYWLVISSVKSNAELYSIIPTPFPLAPTLTHFHHGADDGQAADVSGQQPDRIKDERGAQHAAGALCRLQLRYRFTGRQPVMLFMLSAQMFRSENCS